MCTHKQRIVKPSFRARSTGRPLDDADFVFAAGPAASETMRKRYEHIPTQTTPRQR
ncbi:hypothetical protein AB0C47_16300 [Micromonospora taraxaci]|uniref:hypothetical protein n=1 Tax=Micromonospora taraxaci TaxID=1316803 RepID=UPI003406E29A